MDAREIGIRWTIGAVSPEGFEALRLSVWGAYNIFGPKASYVVCLNSMPLEEARTKTGPLPESVRWHAVGTKDLPPLFERHLDSGMAEGVAWKFAPLRYFPDLYEIALDNDCILWDLPPAMRAWLDRGERDLCLLAEDVRPCFGQYAPICGEEPRNSGIRGLPPGFPLGRALEDMLEVLPVRLFSELDEQGLQVAALSQYKKPLAVSVEDVTICSPFPPHRPYLGKCGAHFVGLNARELPWSFDGRGASDLTREHWQRWKPEMIRKLGL